MRIEIVTGTDEPVIYPLNKPKLIIGASQTCDIIIPAKGISRKHLTLTIEDDRYYILDVGSTNGSYINEERIVPGRKIEFTTFFPIRLGEDTLISLVSDQDAESIVNSFSHSKKSVGSNISDSDATVGISLAQLNRRQGHSTKQIEARRIKSKKQKKSSSVVQNSLVAVGLMAGAVYYTLNRPEPVKTEIQTIGKIVRTAPTVEVAVKKTEPMVDDIDLTKKEAFATLIQDIKCATDIELFLCQNIKGANVDRWGVIQVGTMLNILIDGVPFRDQAVAMLPQPDAIKTGTAPPHIVEIYQSELDQVIAALFIKQAIPEALDYSRLKDYKVTVAFFENAESMIKFNFALAAFPDALEKVQKLLAQKNMDVIKSSGVTVLNFTKDYYRIY